MADSKRTASGPTLCLESPLLNVPFTKTVLSVRLLRPGVAAPLCGTGDFEAHKVPQLLVTVLCYFLAIVYANGVK